MTESDKPAFAKLIANVYSFYQKESSSFALGVWWEGMSKYDFDAVRVAMNRHAVNPDAGQFLPKPADIVKLIEGNSTDKAVTAWALVVDAIRRQGPYMSVDFNDARTARIVVEMGGWVKVCEVTNDELPFRQREFENRYRSMLNTNEHLGASSRVAGLIEADNARLSLQAPDNVVQLEAPVRDPIAALSGAQLARLALGKMK